MSETSASKSAFDPSKFCECQKCFSIHRRGFVAEELKSPAAMVDVKNCKWCLGSGWRPGDVNDSSKGVMKCDHSDPQGEMPF